MFLLNKYEFYLRLSKRKEAFQQYLSFGYK